LRETLEQRQGRW